MRKRASVYRVLVEKPEGKRSLRKPRYRWEDNIKMDLQEMGWGGMDWIDVSKDRGQLVGSCECCNDLSGSTKCREFLD